MLNIYEHLAMAIILNQREKCLLKKYKESAHSRYSYGLFLVKLPFNIVDGINSIRKAVIVTALCSFNNEAKYSVVLFWYKPLYTAEMEFLLLTFLTFLWNSQLPKLGCPYCPSESNRN